MNLKKFTNLESSRRRAILLLRIESLIILGLVVYLLVAQLFSRVSLPNALGAEIVYGLLGSIRS